MSEHNYLGNCFEDGVAYDDGGEFVDICTEHDEPRGECSECPPCPKCEELGTVIK